MDRSAHSFDLLEIVRVRRGRVELLGEHAKRMAASARALRFDDETDDEKRDGTRVETRVRDAVRESVTAAVAASGARDAVFEVRLAQGRASQPTVRRIDAAPFDGDALAEGLRLTLAKIPRDESAPTATHKTTLRRDAETALAEARLAGAHESLFLNKGGRVAGAAGANLFLLDDRGLATPPVAEGAFPGVMRAALLTAARSLAVPIRESPLTLAELFAAPDLLLTASAHGLLSVGSIDGRPLEPPRRGSLRKGLVPRLRLRLHELCDLAEL